jgi:hypothetical protein
MPFNRVPIMTREFITMTGSLRGQAKSSSSIHGTGDTLPFNRVPIMTREFIPMTGSLRGRAKSSRTRRQVKNARKRGFRHVENVFGRQHSHRALQPAAIEQGIGIHSIFMQNKPNFLDNPMNINPFMTNYYEHKTSLRPPAKQTQSNPISDPAIIFFCYKTCLFCKNSYLWYLCRTLNRH